MGNPSGRSQLGLGTWSSIPDKVVAAPGRAPIVVESLWLYVTLVEYENCAGDHSVALLDEPGAIDAVAGFSQDIGSKLGAEDYCRLALSIARAPQALVGAPEALRNSAVLITGTRTDGAAFDIVGNFSAAFDARTMGPPLDSQRTPLLLGLDVGTLFSAIDVDAGEPADDGMVHLEFSDASGGQGPLIDALDSSLTLHFDANQNGAIDADEPNIRQP